MPEDKLGAIAALFPPEEAAQQIYDIAQPILSQIEGAVVIPKEEYHLTLCYIGDTDLGSNQRADLPYNIRASYAMEYAASFFYDNLEGKVSGIGRFNTVNENDLVQVYASFDSPRLPHFRHNVESELNMFFLMWDQEHGFTPHITLAYIPESAEMPDIKFPEIEVAFTHVSLLWGEERINYSLSYGVNKSVAQKLIKSKVLEKSIHENDEGDLIIPVIGIPFGTEKSKDIDGDYFDKDTDVGPLKTVYSYFDHGYDKNYIPDGVEGFGKQLIGVAERGETTDEGIIYNIIVDRRKKYKNLIGRLVKEGVLDASSAVRFREDDETKPGRVKTWHVCAVDLTPTPNNPQARSLVKSFLEVDMPEDKKADGVVQQDQPETTPQNGSEGTKSPTPVTDAVRAAFAKSAAKKTDEDKDDGADTQETEDQSDIASLVKSAIAAEIPAIVKAVAEEVAKSLEKSFKDLGDGIVDIQTAIPVLGEEIANHLTGEVEASVAKSKLELETSGKLRKNTGTKPPASNGKTPGGVPLSFPGAQRSS